MEDFKPSLKFFFVDVALLVVIVLAYHTCY